MGAKNMRQWLGFYVALVVCCAGFVQKVEAQEDPAKAREQYNACKALLSAQKPCDALLACESGLKSMDIAALRTLTDQARSACVQVTKSERAAAVEAQKRDRPCPDEKVRNAAGQCCWEGQVANTKTGEACTGVPTRCPEGWNLDIAGQVCSQTPCPEGQIHADETHCCWPGQVWLASRDRCLGVPECAGGLQAEGESCVPIIPDQDLDKIPDAGDACPTVAEDIDAFEDADGCPEPDNDADGVCDAIFAASITTNQSMIDLDCQGSDGCPDSPEDIDTFQDGDGCPDLDNDGDTFADALDLCPDEAGVSSHGGCPPPPDYTLQILGWTGVGVGSALLVTGTGLLLSTIEDRETLNNPSVSLERADVVLSITEVEAQDLRDSIDTKNTIAAVSFGVGGAVLVGGVVALVLDAFGSEDDSPSPVTVGVDASGGVWCGWTF